jgi:ABC-type transport system involved in multi-copper enzyme maturation permease subunit
MGIAILADLVLAFLLASYAGSKGRSFWLWFLISVIFDPIVGFIALHLSAWLKSVIGSQSSKSSRDTPQNIRDVTPSQPESETFSADELYRQSEHFQRQAKKYKDMADQIQEQELQSSDSKKITWHSR